MTQRQASGRSSWLCCASPWVRRTFVGALMVTHQPMLHHQHSSLGSCCTRVCTCGTPAGEKFVVTSAMKELRVCTFDDANNWWCGEAVRKADKSNAWRPPYSCLLQAIVLTPLPPCPSFPPRSTRHHLYSSMAPKQPNDCHCQCSQDLPCLFCLCRGDWRRV